MKSLARRVHRLQRQFAPIPDYLQNPRDRFRLVVSGMDHPLNLATSRCTRTLCPNGTLLEVVHLDGIRGNLTDEELDRFVSTFPVDIMAGPREMKAAFRLLGRLEQRLALHADTVSRRAAELLRERRQRRLEAGGRQYEELPWHTVSVPPGRRAWAGRSVC